MLFAYVLRPVEPSNELLHVVPVVFIFWYMVEITRRANCRRLYEKVNFLFIAEPKLRHPRCVARQILGNGEECFTSRQVDFPTRRVTSSTRRVASSTRRVVRNSPPLVEGRSADV